MRSIINIILIICAVFIVIEFVLACVSYKNREKLLLSSKKKTWKIAGILMALIALIPVGVILLYIIITPILMRVRGDCFVGYYIEGRDTIYYQGSLYHQITDEEKEDEAYEYGKGLWICENTYVADESIKFPYIEYWLPDIMFGYLYYPGEKDARYISVSTIGQVAIYITNE